MGRYQPMPIMNLVWPITALYMRPLGVWAYWRVARAPAQGMGKKMGDGMDMGSMGHQDAVCLIAGL